MQAYSIRLWVNCASSILKRQHLGPHLWGRGVVGNRQGKGWDTKDSVRYEGDQAGYAKAEPASIRG